ncbi:MAG: tRNA uridine-5-carboxymethylaminomethyl(34) synthesis GTPase MnmE [Alphaproteobacteria bacterium]|nr:tRNA uridine-5-carboxymethylaminomethyl(34) synthesis GTPase MnmE [Alphaproteobacteria bacterium]
MTRTVFALASGSYRAGVAVVRISGPEALQTLEALTGKKDFPPRQARLHTLRDPETSAVLDHGIAVYFKAPASFTGEDVVEYHLHGGRAVIDGMLRALGKFENCRMAEPGEFTKRAFENGKLDLTAAEAVADLVAAETEAQRLQALNQLGGALEKLYQGWTDRLSGLLAHQEAEIEFPDEDLPQGLADTLSAPLEELLQEIRAHLNDARRGERLRDGILIAIIGAPNAGKSSLLNALAAREAAIVSEQAGTTRDVIEVHLDLAGYPVILADTAGLRATGDSIEAEGIRRAQAVAEKADIRLALFDATLAERDAETLSLVDENTIAVFTKSDLAKNPPGKISGSLALSSRTGAGMDELLKMLGQKTAALFGARENAGPALTRERHRLALEEAAAALERAKEAALPELAAEDMRLALRALGRITGKVHVEELLDKIFRDFCIGK